MIVKAQTVYTKDLLKKFMRFNSCKKPSQIIIYCFLELFMLGLVGFSIIKAISMGSAEDIIVAIIFTAIFPFVVPLVLLLLPVLLTSMNKSAIGAVNNYEFYDNEAIVVSTVPSASGQTKAKYSFFESVYETKDIFYLYISKRRAFVLKKQDITEGSISDLKTIFKNNLPTKKYIVKSM